MVIRGDDDFDWGVLFMNIDKLFEDILLARKQKLIERVSPNNLQLVLNPNTYKALKEWYQDTMTYPITSLIIDKKEYPLNRVFDMDIELRDINEDFRVEVVE